MQSHQWDCSRTSAEPVLAGSDGTTTYIYNRITCILHRQLAKDCGLKPGHLYAGWKCLQLLEPLRGELARWADAGQEPGEGSIASKAALIKGSIVRPKLPSVVNPEGSRYPCSIYFGRKLPIPTTLLPKYILNWAHGPLGTLKLQCRPILFLGVPSARHIIPSASCLCLHSSLRFPY